MNSGWLSRPVATIFSHGPWPVPVVYHLQLILRWSYKMASKVANALFNTPAQVHTCDMQNVALRTFLPRLPRNTSSWHSVLITLHHLPNDGCAEGHRAQFASGRPDICLTQSQARRYYPNTSSSFDVLLVNQHVCNAYHSS